MLQCALMLFLSNLSLFWSSQQDYSIFSCQLLCVRLAKHQRMYTLNPTWTSFYAEMTKRNSESRMPFIILFPFSVCAMIVFRYHLFHAKVFLRRRTRRHSEYCLLSGTQRGFVCVSEPRVDVLVAFDLINHRTFPSSSSSSLRSYILTFRFVPRLWARVSVPLIESVCTPILWIIYYLCYMYM